MKNTDTAKREKFGQLPLFDSVPGPRRSLVELRRLAEAIKDRVDVVTVANWFGWTYDPHKRNPCPACYATSSSRQTVQLDPDGRRWFCHACREHGDVVDFIAKRFDVPKSRAIERLAGRLNIDTSPESFLAFLSSELSAAAKAGLAELSETAAIERKVRSTYAAWYSLERKDDPATFGQWLAAWESVEIAAWTGNPKAVDAARRLAAAPTPPTPSRASKAAAGRLAAFYARTLATVPPPNCVTQLHARGLDPRTVARFGLGASNADVESRVFPQLYKTPEFREWLDAGFVYPGSPARSALSNRLIVPIRDPAGRAIAFAGRRLDDAAGPKYVNTRESAIFQKARTFYGFSEALPAILATGVAIVTEGYFHVLSSHDAGIGNVVATMGTALTDRHAHVLRRVADRVVLAFDGDAAGRTAASDAASMLTAYGLAVDVAPVPDGYDLDDIKRKAGAATLARILAEAAPAVRVRRNDPDALAARLELPPPKNLLD